MVSVWCPEYLAVPVVFGGDSRLSGAVSGKCVAAGRGFGWGIGTACCSKRVTSNGGKHTASMSTVEHEGVEGVFGASFHPSVRTTRPEPLVVASRPSAPCRPTRRTSIICWSGWSGSIRGVTAQRHVRSEGEGRAGHSPSLCSLESTNRFRCNRWLRCCQQAKYIHLRTGFVAGGSCRR